MEPLGFCPRRICADVLRCGMEEEEEDSAYWSINWDLLKHTAILPARCQTKVGINAVMVTIVAWNAEQCQLPMIDLPTGRVLEIGPDFFPLRGGATRGALQRLAAGIPCL